MLYCANRDSISILNLPDKNHNFIIQPRATAFVWVLLDSALDYNLRVFPCRRRRLLFCGEEDGPGGDHGAGSAEEQRVLVKRGGPGRPGRPQHSHYALSGGRSQSAAIYK